MPVATDPMSRRGFGRWLIDQKGRSDSIGELAKCVAADPSFPRDGDVFAAWKRINQIGADGDMLVAMEEAESIWGTLQ